MSSPSAARNSLIRWLLTAHVVAGLIAWSTSVHGKDRLHLLTVQGNVAGADADVMTVREMIGRTWGNTFASHVAQDGRGDRQKLLDAVDKLAPAANDIVLFYYSGHGATRGNRHYLALDSREQFFRDELRNRLVAKGARLTILLTDCCAVRERIPEELGAAARLEDVLVQNLNRLFGASGVADINSAYVGQLAWGNPNGGVFTSALAETLWKPCENWQAFFITLQVETQRNYGIYRRLALSRESTWRPQDKELVRRQSTQTAQHFGLPGGLPITEVFPFTSATKMTDEGGRRIRPERGDRLVSINGHRIADSRDFIRVIQGMPRNARYTMVVVNKNDGKQLRLSGQLDQGGEYRLGMQIDDLLPEKDQDGRPFPGLQIVTVYRGTAAKKLRSTSGRPITPEPGDRLLYINDKIVMSVSHFQRAIRHLPRNADISITVIDKRSGNYLVLLGQLDQGGNYRLGMLVRDPE